MFGRRQDPSVAMLGKPDLRLTPGAGIVLAGAFRRGLEDWQLEVVANGFIPEQRMSKHTRLLVVADSAARSWKARAARRRNIPIIDESGLTHAWGLKVPAV